MWFKKLITLIKFKLLQRRYKHEVAANEERKYCEELLKLINASAFKRYDPQKIGTINLRSLYPNIDAFTLKINDTNALILQGVKVPNKWISTDLQRVSFDSFLCSKENYYLDPLKEIEKFKIAALRLCELMAESDSAKYGIYEHDLRILGRMFLNIREISISIITLTV